MKEVISYTNFLLDSVTKAKSNLSHEAKLRATVVAKNDQLQSQLDRLSTDVKHDKDFIKALLIGTRESEDCEQSLRKDAVEMKSIIRSLQK